MCMLLIKIIRRHDFLPWNSEVKDEKKKKYRLTALVLTDQEKTRHQIIDKAHLIREACHMIIQSFTWSNRKNRILESNTNVKEPTPGILQ